MSSRHFVHIFFPPFHTTLLPAILNTYLSILILHRIPPPTMAIAKTILLDTKWEGAKRSTG